MAVEFKRWKGAVEPAETSPSANEFKRWKGAVEPAYVAPPMSGGEAKTGPGLSFGVFGKVGASQ